jgi:cation diffusion facilitator family transporter
MLSEGIHSVVDTSNGCLVLYGLRRGRLRPDLEHPLGYGREMYFWSFVVAVLLFALGAGASFYQGIIKVLDPQPVEHVTVNYVVLFISALFDGTTWWLALPNFRGSTPYTGLYRAIRDSKDPPSFTVLFEVSAALLGLLIAFAGIHLSVNLRLPVLDGISSILIGLILVTTAFLLTRETKSLLIGEPADQDIVKSIMNIAETIQGVAHANGVLILHLALRQIVIALSLEFADELRTPAIEGKVIELEHHVRHSHSQVLAIFVKPQSRSGFTEIV